MIIINIIKKFSRTIIILIYYSILRFLPQYLPNGHECRKVRSFFCKYLFQKCGRNVNIKRKAFFGSGKAIQIGDNSDIGLNCQIFGIDGGGELVIGNNVMMGPDVIILTVAHDISTSISFISSKRKKTRVIIDDGAWIGIRSIIMPGVSIGKNSIVGAGAVVTKDVPPNTIVGGVPAHIIMRSEINY